MNWKETLDSHSYALGMAAAFCECVAAECKRAGFSAPIVPGDYESQREAMEQIARDHGVLSYYEASLDQPGDRRICFWVFYKYPETLEEYLSLRGQGLHPVVDLNPFYGVLSYGTAYGRTLAPDEARDNTSRQVIGRTKEENN